VIKTQLVFAWPLIFRRRRLISAAYIASASSRRFGHDRQPGDAGWQPFRTHEDFAGRELRRRDQREAVNNADDEMNRPTRSLLAQFYYYSSDEVSRLSPI